MIDIRSVKKNPNKESNAHAPRTRIRGSVIWLSEFTCYGFMTRQVTRRREARKQLDQLRFQARSTSDSGSSSADNKDNIKKSKSKVPAASTKSPSGGSEKSGNTKSGGRKVAKDKGMFSGLQGGFFNRPTQPKKNVDNKPKTAPKNTTTTATSSATASVSQTKADHQEDSMPHIKANAQSTSEDKFRFSEVQEALKTDQSWYGQSLSHCTVQSTLDVVNP